MEISQAQPHGIQIKTKQCSAFIDAFSADLKYTGPANADLILTSQAFLEPANLPSESKFFSWKSKVSV